MLYPLFVNGIGTPPLPGQSIFKDRGTNPTKVGDTYLIPVNSSRVQNDLYEKKTYDDTLYDPNAFDIVYEASRDGSSATKLNGVLGDLYSGVQNSASSIIDFLNQIKESISGNGDPNNPLNPPSASQVNFPSSAIDYLYADLAKHYGMSPETAYQEALSNTAYSRAVRDMQNAGLNPATIFGAGRSSGSGGVSYISKNGSNSGSSYYQNAKEDNSLFGDKNFMSALGTLVAVAIGKNPALGGTIGKGVASLFEAFE